MVKYDWTEEERIAQILERTDEKGFLEEMVEWMRRNIAPAKRRRILEDLRFWRSPNKISHEDLCQLVLSLDFRASEGLENRMLLGASNDWAKKYFENFPKGVEQDGAQV